MEKPPHDCNYNTNMVQMESWVQNQSRSAPTKHMECHLSTQKRIRFIHIPCLWPLLWFWIFSMPLYTFYLCASSGMISKKNLLILLPKLLGKIYCILFLFYYVFALDILQFLCSFILILHKHFFIFFSFIFFLHYVYDLFLIMICNLQHENKTSST
jgi:hypothetical protein